MKIIISNNFEKEAKKKKKNWKYNPWAICYSKIDKKKNPEKAERCIHHLKEKQSSTDINIIKEARELSVPQQHQKSIAIKTLKMNDIGAMIMGGMTKDEARSFLRSIGWSDERISNIENLK